MFYKIRGGTLINLDNVIRMDYTLSDKYPLTFVNSRVEYIHYDDGVEIKKLLRKKGMILKDEEDEQQ